MPLYEDMAPWNIFFEAGKLIYIDYDTRNLHFDEAVPMAYQVIEVLMNYKRTVQVSPLPLLLCWQGLKLSKERLRSGFRAVRLARDDARLAAEGQDLAHLRVRLVLLRRPLRRPGQAGAVRGQDVPLDVRGLPESDLRDGDEGEGEDGGPAGRLCRDRLEAADRALYRARGAESCVTHGCANIQKCGWYNTRTQSRHVHA